MRPTLHLGGMQSGVGGDVRWSALSGPMQGFDARRTLSQILSLQALHYLTLSFILPLLLALLAIDKDALNFQGGFVSLSLVLDWREIAGKPIVDGGQPWPWNRYHEMASQHDIDFLRDSNLNTSDVADGTGIRRWWEYDAFIHLDATHFVKVPDADQIAWEGKRLGKGSLMEKVIAQRERLVQQQQLSGGTVPEPRDDAWWQFMARDASRGWAIVLAWAVTGAVDVFLLSTLIRRPTHILDHTITLHVIHLAVTWLYTRSFPSSLFYWMVMAAHVGATVVWAEALSIRREMRAGWQSGLEASGGSDSHAASARARSKRGTSRGSNDDERGRLLAVELSSNSRSAAPHVLFDDEEDGDLERESETKRNGRTQRGESIEMKRL